MAAGTSKDGHDIDSSIYEAVVEGDIKVLNWRGQHLSSFRTPGVGNTIVHLAVRHRQLEIVKKAIILLPDLLRQKNNFDNIPLHEAAAFGNQETVQLLISSLRDSKPYLLEVNCHGDTPFHVALRSQNIAAAEVLLSYVHEHPEILVMKTELLKETPLHLFVRYCAGKHFPPIIRLDDNSNAVSKQPFINQLVDANFSAILALDSEDLTPLMRAAQFGHVFILWMLLRYRHLTECLDSKGKSFLHHLRLRLADLNARDREYTVYMCKRIFNLPGVDILTISQDQNGNTPLHLAILDKDFDLAQLILERYVEAYLSTQMELIVDIKNMEGKTVFDLVKSEPSSPSILKNLMELAGRGRIMDQKQYKAARDLDVGVLDTHDDFFDSNVLCQDVRGKNILHIAIEHDYEDRSISGVSYREFINKAIARYPKLMYQKDCNEDTPLHLAARLLNDAATVLLEESVNFWFSKMEANWIDLELFPPWKVRNLRGDTLLHEVVRTSVHTGNYSVLNTMCKMFSAGDIGEAVSDVNEYGETVLHLIARYSKEIGSPDLDSDDYYYLKAFMKAKDTAVYKRDLDGLTPIMRAAHCGQLWLVSLIITRFPESTSISDYKGRNVLHHLCIQTSGSNMVTNLNDILDLWGGIPLLYIKPGVLIFLKDTDGNTPLHLAIMHQNYEVADYLIRLYVKRRSSSSVERLSEIKNNDGKSVMDLIKSGVGVPSNFKELLEPFTGGIMDDTLYKAAVKGDTRIAQLRLYKKDKWRIPARDGSSVMHIALRHHHINFAQYVIMHLYELIYLKDSKGDTPLHVAADIKNDEALTFFKECHNIWMSSDSSTHHQDKFPPPWKVKNLKGNTYLHEGVRMCNYKVIFSELLNGIELKEVMNDRGETVLHMAARYGTYAAKESIKCCFEHIMPLVYMRDFEGFTPIVRAAQYGRLGMARLLIQRCPQSVDIRDNKGRTFLHYMRALVADLVDDLRDTLPVWKDFFKQPGVHDLRSAQDEDGNTPLHLAIINANFTEAKFLMEICLLSQRKGELCIENNDRDTILNLLSERSRSNIPAVRELKQLLSRDNIMERQLSYTMEEKLYRAAIQGDIQIFQEGCAEAHIAGHDVESGPHTLDIDFCSQTVGGSNIIHLALKDRNSNNAELFVKTALQHFPHLSLRSDSNGDTPLHLAAKWEGGLSLADSLIKAATELLSNLDESKKAFHVAPWAVKNYKGNFPIHEALQSGNFQAAYALLCCDNDGASLVNDFGETPLHAFANNGFPVSADNIDLFMNTLKQKGNLATLAAYAQDTEGRTPLMSAARSGRLQVVGAILKHHPQLAYFRDPKGKTFLHVLRFTGEDVDENVAVASGMELLKVPEADAQRLVQDNDGNTPLHCAIKNGNSTAAILLTRRCLDSQNRAELGLMNKDGDTIPYLIASHGNVPSEIIELMQHKAPEAVCLNRSSYGINKMEMKESANALSVVAALLATITFAAAFQVPGGFGDDGLPILLQKPAFAIFSVANTIAMCSSMLCLFLLLWVMGIGKTHGSLMILDASIFLLRVSFYLTLVTFTTGMFVVTVEKSLWLAILVCVFSFLTFLLTRRSLILLVSNQGRRAINGIETKLKNL